MKKIVIDIKTGQVKGNIDIVENDNKSDIYKIYILKNKAIYDLTGKTPRMVMIDKKQNIKQVIDLNITDAKRGEVSLQVSDAWSRKDGRYICQLAIFGLEGFLEQSTYFWITIKNSLFNDVGGEILADPQFEMLKQELEKFQIAFSKIEEWDKYFKETSGKIEEKYTDRLNKVELQFSYIEKETTSMFNEPYINYIAHRGCWLNVPENTLESIIEAKKYGYNFVELDVTRTLDGVWCLMHDLTLDRTTTGSGKVTEVSWDYISGLEIDYLKYDNRIYRVPLLEDAVRLCKKLGLRINIDGSKIEWTDEKIIEIVTLLKKYNMFEKCFFVVSPTIEKIFTKLYPNVYITWLWATKDDANNLADVLSCKKRRHAFISRHISDVTDYLIEICMQYDVPLFIYGCNDLKTFNAAVNYGAKFIETDKILPQ